MLRVIRELVSLSDVVKCNEAEAAALGRMLEPEAVVVTRGERGALVISNGRTESVEGVEAEVVDATGAGDSVAGVIAAGLAAGVTPGELAPVVALAMEVAAGVVAEWGATEGLPSAEEARALLASVVA